MVLWAMAARILLPIHPFSSWLDPADHPFTKPLAAHVVGALIFAAGLWLLHRSHADLGTRWSATVEFQSDHQLVSDGPHRRIRHPGVLGTGLRSIGLASLVPRLLAGLLALPIPFGVAVLCMPREERAAREEFGPAYRAHMDRTGRILPRWR
jgi:protein-S-isoprenylcysteine O-methyltransferase Ste14